MKTAFSAPLFETAHANAQGEPPYDWALGLPAHREDSTWDARQAHNVRWTLPALVIGPSGTETCMPASSPEPASQDRSSHARVLDGRFAHRLRRRTRGRGRWGRWPRRPRPTYLSAMLANGVLRADGLAAARQATMGAGVCP